MKNPRKRTAEEIAADQARSEDLDRRLLAMIEKYRALVAEKRAASGEQPAAG